MSRKSGRGRLRPAVLLASCAVVIGGSPAGDSVQRASGAGRGVEREKGGQEEFGPYEVVDNWPKPLPDGPDGVKHDGWTWGSIGAVFAGDA